MNLIQEFKIPLRPSLLKIRRQTVRWIILHHTAEIYDNPEARIDSSAYQLPALFKGVAEKKQADVKYHYVVEKVKDEYVAFTIRPFTYLCEWADIPVNINNRAIHVALLGNYDFKIPEPRLYNILAFRVINPLLKLYGLAPSRIKLHREVSTNKNLSCPGDFINKNIIISMVRRYVIK